MIKVQDWVLKESNVSVSPIIDNTVLVKHEETGKRFSLFLFLILSYY